MLSHGARADFKTDCGETSPKRLTETAVSITDGKTSAEITAEVALTQKQRLRGLMCRKELRDTEGMLFVFSRLREGGFWMFNTYVDMDIIYMADGKAVSVAGMKKCPRKTGEKNRAWAKRCSTEARKYLPRAPYNTALEVPAGWLERKGFNRTGKIRAEWKLPAKAEIRQ